MAVISLSSTLLWALGLSVPLAAMTVSSTPEEDSRLVEEVLGGNPEAFRGLVERYQGRIYNVIYGMVHNRDDAMELSQDSFLKAYRKLDSFHLGTKFYTWLCRIAINTTIDFLRKHKNRHSVEFDENIAVRTDAGLFDGHTSNNPEKNAEQEELKKLVMAEVDKLPEDQKQILILKEIDGLSYKEIAEVVGIPQGTVMSRLYYARKRLQEALAGKDS